MKIIIKGNPIAKARHRSSNRGKVTFRKGHMQVIPQLYDPKSEEKKQVTEFLKKTLMLAKLSKDKQIASDFQSFWNSSESRTGENTVNAIRKIVAFAHKYNDILRRIVSKTTPKKDKVP